MIPIQPANATDAIGSSQHGSGVGLEIVFVPPLTLGGTSFGSIHHPTPLPLDHLG